MEFLPKAQSILVRKEDIPKYLRHGDFYKSLSDDDPLEQFPVPADTTKPTLELSTVHDLVHLLSSLRFWMVADLPVEVFEFVLANDTEQLTVPFHKDLPYLPHTLALKSLHESEKADGLTLISCAVKVGYLPILHLLYDRGGRWDAQAGQYAVQSGSAECLQFVLDHGVSLSTSDFKQLFSLGSLSCIQYLHKRALPEERLVAHYACSLTAAGRHLDCLQYLHTQGFPWNSTTCSDAAEHGHLECLRYARENGCLWEASAWRGAAAGGHQHILDYLAEHNCPWHIRIMHELAEAGSTDGLGLLSQMGRGWDESVCAVAARWGRLPVLKYLRENGCPWDELTIENAARNGSYGCFVYAQKQGCRVTSTAIEFARRGQHHDILNYIKNNNCAAGVLDYYNNSYY